MVDKIKHVSIVLGLKSCRTQHTQISMEPLCSWAPGQLCIVLLRGHLNVHKIMKTWPCV